MSRDYKYRSQNRRLSKSAKNRVAWWKWLLAALLVTLFAAFLVFLRFNTPKNAGPQPVTPPAASKQPEQQEQEPHYDFYTILPKAEIVVPDYEIKTRVREEKVGRIKSVQYMIQAGSFRDYNEADKLRARLALMGIESKVEKAEIGNTAWHRVKLGPFDRSSSVAAIKARLKENGIDAIVTETEG